MLWIGEWNTCQTTDNKSRCKQTKTSSDCIRKVAGRGKSTMYQSSTAYNMYMAEQQPQGRLRIANDSLMCKNGCDFYGNKHWNGLCSKCYRKQNSQRGNPWPCTHGRTIFIHMFLSGVHHPTSGRVPPVQRPSQATLSLPEGKVPELTSPSSSNSTTSSLLNSVQKTFKKETLKRALFNKDSSKSSSQPKQVPSKEELQYNESFKALKLDEKAQQELKLRVNQLYQSIKQKREKLDVDQLSDMVQNFYIKVADSMERPDSPFFALSPTEKTEALDFLESCVISRLHK